MANILKLVGQKPREIHKYVSGSCFLDGMTMGDSKKKFFFATFHKEHIVFLIKKRNVQVDAPKSTQMSQMLFIPLCLRRRGRE